MAELELHIAALRYLMGVFYSFRNLREQAAHLFLGLKVELAVGESQPVGICEIGSGLYAEQDIVIGSVLSADIVDVVCGHHLYSGLPAQLYQQRVYPFLFRQALVLDLQKEIALAEYVLKLKRLLFCAVIVAGHQQPLHITGQAGAGSYYPAAVLPEQVHIRTRLVVKALCK